MALVTATAALPIQRAAVRPVRPTQNKNQATLSLTVRGRRVVALLALLPIAIALFFLGTHTAQAMDSAPKTAIVKVEAGQTLWDVAVKVAPNEDPRSTIWTIREMNHLATSEVQAGQALTVPAN